MLFGGFFTRALSIMNTNCAMPQGDSSPSVGMVKSTSVVGLPFVSTSLKLGSLSVNGPYSIWPRFMAAKFSPLIQIRSTEPPSLRPAVFSASTRETASAVSASFTWRSVTPCSACTRVPTHWI